MDNKNKGINLDSVTATDMTENKKIDDLGTQLKICLFVEHYCSEMSHSVYMIEPPLDLSNYDQLVDSQGFMSDSKNIRPLLTFREQNRFLDRSASVNLGSKIYFFGGMHDNRQKQIPKELPYQVQVFDTDHPCLGMQTVAALNAPKESPCVFVADGMIYALGSALTPGTSKRGRPRFKGSGFFERYHPSSNHWEILPDPPAPFLKWKGEQFLDDATVVGRLVFISSFFNFVFNLDTLDWEPRLPLDLAARFPFGSLFVADSASLYYLHGPGSRKLGTAYVPGRYFGDRLQVLKTGPLTITREGDYVSSLLNSHCLVSGKKRVLAEGIDLDENMFFTELVYFPWRDLFHIGGRIFCYVATAQLVDGFDFTHNEPYSRGVLIKFFEEVQAHSDNFNGEDNNETQFRPLASFSYKINTDFQNASFFIRCSVLGTVPESWIKAPLKEKSAGMKTVQRMHEAKQGRLGFGSISWLGNCKVENTESSETRESELVKLLSVRDEEISRLTAELAEKNKLWKAYEELLTESVDVNG